MCGLVGLYARHSTSDNHVKLLNQLLWLDQMRGEHATGIAKVDLAKNTVAVHKAAVSATDFLAQQETKDFFSKDRGRVWIGHNRFATMGDKTDNNNAHPFTYKHITMAHNGTVDRWTLKNLDGFDECKVDSEMVCRTIAEKGAQEAVTKYLSGAFALVWYDSEERSLNFIRNEQRPLYLATLSDNTLVWASDDAYLDFVITGNLKQPLNFNKEGAPTQLPPNVLFTWKFNANGVLVDTKPTAKQMKFNSVPNPNPPVVTRGRYSGGTIYGGYGGYDMYDDDDDDARYARTQQHQRRTTVSTHDTMDGRINALLDKNNLNVKNGDEITFDFIKWVEYSNSNKGFGILTGSFGTQNFEVQAYNVEWEKIEGSLRLRGEISNAYTRINNGVTNLVITVQGVVRNIAKEKKPEGGAEGAGAGGKADTETDSIPFDSHWVPGTWPLKVDGFTFNNRFEFEQIASHGCALCDKTPSFRNTLNPKMSVYAPTGVGQSRPSLSRYEFICGNCNRKDELKALEKMEKRT